MCAANGSGHLPVPGSGTRDRQDHVGSEEHERQRAAGAIDVAVGVTMINQESGLAAGLVDSSFNIGSALGIAILTTVALARTDDVLASANQPVDPAFATTEGFQSAFLVAGGIALLGVVCALSLFGRREEAEEEAAEVAARPAPPCPGRATAMPAVQLEGDS
jgi:drug/metabolite transporter (DMT)-like permease